jgi:beta-galactosidase
MNGSATNFAMGGSTDKSPIAVLNDYDSRWAIDFQKHTNKWDYVTQFNDLYRALSSVPQYSGQTIDILSPQADLTPYPLVIAPALNVLPEATAQHLLAYVQQGGHLILGPRSGMKDADNSLDPRKQPGPLAAALGANVDQYYALDKPIDLTGFGTATIWAELLHPTSPEAKPILTYAPNAGWLANEPAAITTKVGKGELTYLGATLDQPAAIAFYTRQLAETTIKPILPNLPAGVELMQRTGANGARIWIILNHANEPRTLPALPAGKSLLGNDPVTLPPHQVLVWNLQ